VTISEFASAQIAPITIPPPPRYRFIANCCASCGVHVTEQHPNRSVVLMGVLGFPVCEDAIVCHAGCSMDLSRKLRAGGLQMALQDQRSQVLRRSKTVPASSIVNAADDVGCRPYGAALATDLIAKAREEGDKAGYARAQQEFDLFQREAREALVGMGAKVGRLEERLEQEFNTRLHAEHALERARGGGKLHPGGSFRKRGDKCIAVDDTIVKRVFRAEATYELTLEFTDAARVALGWHGTHFFLLGQTWHAMPWTVRAESWWHLCSLIGVPEIVARAFYQHPEESQPSAVAVEPAFRHRRGPVRERLVVRCQGEED
jgi:hypothetical protein